MTEGEQRRDHAANTATCGPTATMARARHELEWLQLEGVAAQVSKEAGGERVEEGGRCVRREREPKREAGGVRGGRGGAVKGAEARRRLKRCVTQG